VVEVDAEPVTLRVAIGKEPRLEHLVRREANAWDDVGGREGGLLDFGEIVLRVAVELHDPDLDQRIFGLWPDFGKVEGIVSMGPRLSFRHYLDEERPAREVAGLDRAEKVSAMAFAILGNESFGFRVGEICNPLLGAKMEFDPDALVRGINH
jgi:hypothetical protein